MKLKDLIIYIVDNSKLTAEALAFYFKDVSNVTVKCADICNFYEKNKDRIDCLVSPANAYGLMTGGYDAALSDILGWDFQKKVQQYIKKVFYGEQPVATSFIIKTDIDNLSLIHTPSMQYPSLIKDDMIVYYCMRSTLMCALKNNIKNIVIPVFGASCGGVDPETAAKRMKEAYDQIKNKTGYEVEF